MALRDKVIEQAEKWVGYLEKKSNSQLESMTANAGYNNYTIFAKWYKEWFGEDYQAQPWCAMFVSDMIYLGCDNKEVVPHFAYCPDGVNWFKRNGLWKTDKPQRGDVIFFRGSDGLACHVGLVSSASSDKVVTIEGNTSSAAGVEANGGCVAKKSYSIYYSRILGYGQPPYSKYEPKTPAIKPVTPKKEDDEVVTKKTIVIDGKKCEVNVIDKDNVNYVKLRDFGLAGYSVKYEDNLPQITAPNTRVVDKKIDDILAKELKEKFGIEDKTIEYIYKYIYGEELINKLLK